MTNIDELTHIVLSRCDQLAMCSEESGRLTRTFLRPPMRQVHQQLRQWMSEAGLEVRVDAIGNMIGRKSGSQPSVFVVGSHVDTVPNAGKYDGIIGVMLGIAAVQALASRTFRRSLDVIAFSEEEGVRFRTPYLGSRTVCGQLTAEHLNLTDADGITLADAIRNFGLDPAQIAASAYPPGQLTGYFEAHIEQGPILESENLPVGVVMGVNGQSRYQLCFEGLAGHAGTLPMKLRRDALAAAAEFVITVESNAKATPGLCATVGALKVEPNATNVVPGRVMLSLDARHHHDQVRLQFVEHLLNAANRIGLARQVVVSATMQLGADAVWCDAGMSGRLRRSIEAVGVNPGILPSGAGHDAAVMAIRCPMAMLFIRSPGGISHHPDEAVREDDVALALKAMIEFLAIELDRE